MAKRRVFLQDKRYKQYETTHAVRVLWDKAWGLLGSGATQLNSTPRKYPQKVAQLFGAHLTNVLVFRTSFGSFIYHTRHDSHRPHSHFLYSYQIDTSHYIIITCERDIKSCKLFILRSLPNPFAYLVCDMTFVDGLIDVYKVCAGIVCCNFLLIH